METAVFQNTAGAVSLFCSILLIFLDTMRAVLIAISTDEQLKKKSIMKPGTVEGIDIFNNWKWNIYEIRIFTASKPKEK